MERVLFDENGNEVIVPDEQTINDFKAGHDKNIERRETEKELKNSLKEFESDDKSMNFRTMRKQNDSLKAKLVEKGEVISDDGKIEKKIDNLTEEKIAEITKKTTNKMFLENRVSSELSRIEDKDKRAIVKKYFEKLSAGEELSNEVIENNLDKAMTLVDISLKSSNSISTSGLPPRFESSDKKKDFTETEEGKKHLEDITPKHILDKKKT